MISQEDYLSFRDRISRGQLGDFTRDRLAEENKSLVSDGSEYENLTDILVQLLRDDQLGDPKRTQIIEELRNLILEFHANFGSGSFPASDDRKRTFRNLSTVINESTPPEIKPLVGGMFELVIDSQDVPDFYLNQVINSFRRYQVSESRLDPWFHLFEQHPSYGAVAVRTILQQHPDSNRLEKLLLQVWEATIEKDLDTKVVILTREVSENQKLVESTESFLGRLIQELYFYGQKRHDDGAFWHSVEDLLDQYPWSRNWLDHVPETSEGRSLLFSEKDSAQIEEQAEAIREFSEEHRPHAVYESIINHYQELLEKYQQAASSSGSPYQSPMNPQLADEMDKMMPLSSGPLRPSEMRVTNGN